MDVTDKLFRLYRLARRRVEESRTLLKTAQDQTQGLDLSVTRQREQLQARAQRELMAHQYLQLAELENRVRAEYGLFVVPAPLRSASRREDQPSGVAPGHGDAE